MRKALFGLACAFAAAVGAWAQGLSGTVRDPAGAVIPGATVTLVCRARKDQQTSDQKGGFSFGERNSYQSCTLSVVKDGLAPYRKVLGRGDDYLEITLQLAVVREAVDARAEADQTALESTTVSRDALKKISNDTAELIAYSEQLAGAAPVPSHTYVDGLPTTNLPPAAMIEAISVNQDPFSPEYADGDENRVEITTRSPDRNFHFALNGSTIGLGGNSALGPHLGSSSRWAAPIVSGPVPHSPLTFSLQANFNSSSSQQLIQAVTSNSGPTPATQVATGDSSNSEAFDLYYSRKENTRAYLSLNRSESTTSNSGVGGLTLAQAGNGTGFDSEELRGSIQTAGEDWVQRSAVLISHRDFRSSANENTLGINVPGYFISGGAPLAGENSINDHWMWKTIFQSSSRRRYWESGIVVSHANDSDQQNPSAAGQIWFPTLSDYTAALSGSPTGTWLGARNAGSGSYGSNLISPFVQSDIWHKARVIVRAGLRGDYESRAGFEISPRLSAITRIDGFVLRAGVGLFVQDWPNSIFVQEQRNNATGAFVATAVSLPANGTGAPTSTNPVSIISQIAPGLDRPRDLMSKTSIDRPFANFEAGLEFTRTDGKHLLGSRRIPDAAGWLDRIESNRDLRRTELHPRIRYRWKKQSLTANYEWMHSLDNTDGPFSYAENYQNLPAEWARSTGVPVHNASLIGNLNLPHSFSLTIVGSAHSSSPYNITTGQDVTHDGLFNDRGGLMRNSGNGPGYQTVSLYGSRRVGLGRLLGKRGESDGLVIGIQVDDLLGTKNYVAVESVEDSPLFGRPLTALPGRTLRVWFNLDK